MYQVSVSCLEELYLRGTVIVTVATKYKEIQTGSRCGVLLAGEYSLTGDGDQRKNRLFTGLRI